MLRARTKQFHLHGACLILGLKQLEFLHSQLFSMTHSGSSNSSWYDEHLSHSILPPPSSPAYRNRSVSGTDTDLPWPWNDSIASDSSLHSPSRNSQLPLPKAKGGEDHPRYNPRKVRCSFCGNFGHSLMNCRQRFDLHQQKMVSHCEKGYHKPHLHDCEELWRCEWCLMHLKTSYVKRWYPREFDYEIEKVRAQKRKNLLHYAQA